MYVYIYIYMYGSTKTITYFQIYHVFDSTFRLIDLIAWWYHGFFGYLQISYSIDLTFYIADDLAYLCEAPGM